MQRMKLLRSFLYSFGSFLHSSGSPLALNQSSQPPEGTYSGKGHSARAEAKALRISSTLEYGLNTTPSITSSNDDVTFQSDETRLYGPSDEEKQLIGITTISVVTHLTLELHAVGQEPTIDAEIAYNLVDLALVTPEELFIDVARAFSLINHVTNLEESRFSNNMVLAQMRPAWELDQRPDLQRCCYPEHDTIRPTHQDGRDNQAAGLLLLLIEALLTHSNHSPYLAASQELMGLFWNMWFICILFRFTSGKERIIKFSDLIVPRFGQEAGGHGSVYSGGSHLSSEYFLTYSTDPAPPDVTNVPMLLTPHLARTKIFPQQKLSDSLHIVKKVVDALNFLQQIHPSVVAVIVFQLVVNVELVE
ncbi:hypothetical protein F4604DRAFT_1913561 [Suillus subluteus]|nr:hypothetical protein F4604DRAFT_1913561 [Suillus subluteus]